jgi:AcrR family transcriptional regulator
MESTNLEPISSPTAVKIVDAAGHLFMQRGYKAVSINDIIRAAEVTKPTLYYYFADKEELFVQMGLRVLTEMGDRLRHVTAAPGSMAERLLALAAEIMADSDRDMRMMRHEMFEHLSPANRQRLAATFFTQLYNPIVVLMQHGLDTGELGRYDAPTLTQMFMGMAESFMEFSPGSSTTQISDASPHYGGPVLTPAILVDLFLHGVAG